MSLFWPLRFLCLAPLAAAAALGQQSPADSVNPLIGTAKDGQTFPAAGVPFAMTQWTPQTRAGETKCVAPYYFADSRIQGFRGSHFLSGSCTQDYGSVTLMPLLSATHLDAEGRASRFDHAHERSRAYEYSVDLLDTGIHADVTGTERTGMLRFQFPRTAHEGVVAIEENHRLGVGSVRIDQENQEVTGINPAFRIYAGNGKPAGFGGYFVVRFSRSFRVGGVWSGASRHQGGTEQSGETSTAGAFVTFDLSAGDTVVARVGTSFTSLEEARKNLVECPATFGDALAEAKGKWNDGLGMVALGKTVSPEQRTTFYTALYHSMLLPRIFSDRDGSYPRFGGGGAVETAHGFTYYDDYSLWDTFRAVHPLFTLLQPRREEDMVRSLLAKGEQGGFLPIFPAWNSYTSEMVGDHADAVIADAWAKGLHGFDAELAYRLMKHNATQVPPSKAVYLDGRGRRGLESYLRYGYIPLEDHISDAFHPDEQVSRTLEYAYDDFLVGEMAEWTGHKSEAQQFYARGQNYRKVIHPTTGYATGRYADGRWASAFDPNKPAAWITEGLPSQYTFFVLHDLPALVKLLGGEKPFGARLDELFREGSYDHGNEPSHHLAYLYNFAGQPEKTDFQVRKILNTLYSDSPGGLAGNDDAGQMSAWYVFSALGFYPVTPGTPRYELGVPLFDEVSLHLPNGTRLHITAPGAGLGRYKVDRVLLNGKPLSGTSILHEQLLAGGELRFELAKSPRLPPR